MPIYEFCCKDCDHIFEEWCKQVEEMGSTRTCPKCTRQAKRIMSQTSFALKGEGWYVTEYGSHKNAPKEESPAQADTTPTDSTSMGSSQAESSYSESGKNGHAQTESTLPQTAERTKTVTEATTPAGKTPFEKSGGAPALKSTEATQKNTTSAPTVPA